VSIHPILGGITGFLKVRLVHYLPTIGMESVRGGVESELLANHGGRFFGDHGWWWFLGGFVPFLLLLGLIGLVVWAVFRLPSRGSGLFPATRGGETVARPDGALEEVRLRYARGEMSREEFLQRSQDLRGVGTAPEEPRQSGSE